MTSPEEHDLPPAPAYEQAASLGHIGLSELFDAYDLLWPRNERKIKPASALAQMVYAEREVRQDMLRDLMTAPPRIESVPYDETAGPEGYMDEVRRVMRYMPLPGKITGSMQDEKVRVDELAAEYLATRPGWLELVEPAEQSNAVYSFTETLRAFALTPRAHVVEEYGAERLRVVKRHFPDLQTDGLGLMLKSAQRLPITRSDLDALRTAIDTLDPVQSFGPDFFQLDIDKQRAIIAGIGKEWHAMADVFMRHAPKLLGSKKRYTQAPLAHLSYTDLMQGFANYPSVPPAEVCRIFWQGTSSFDRLLKQEASRLAKLTHIGRAREEQQKARASKKAPGQREMEYLLNQEEVNPAIVDLMPGYTLELSPEDAVLSIKEFERIIDLNLELFGRAMQRRYRGEDLRTLKLDGWEADDAANKLRGGFNGRLSSLAITYVSLAEEDLPALVKNYNPNIHNLETVSQLLLSVDMRSSRGAHRGILSLLLILRQYAKADTLAKSFHKSVSTGSTFSRGLRSQSAAVAGIVSAWNAAKPIKFGHPGSGKR